MYLAAYHFENGLDGGFGVGSIDLWPAYGRLLASLPATLDLHVCAEHAGGLVVLDACPSRAAFEAFSRGAPFTGAVRDAGLPAPRIVDLGEVRRAALREPVAP